MVVINGCPEISTRGKDSEEKIQRVVFRLREMEKQLHG